MPPVPGHGGGAAARSVEQDGVPGSGPCAPASTAAAPAAAPPERREPQTRSVSLLPLFSGSTRDMGLEGVKHTHTRACMYAACVCVCTVC